MYWIGSTKESALMVVFASINNSKTYCRILNGEVWQLFYATSNSESISNSESYIDLLKNPSGFQWFSEYSEKGVRLFMV